MNNTIIGKHVYNAKYGKGEIVKFDEELIWVKFDDQSSDICFHALAAFSNSDAALVTKDAFIEQYVKNLKEKKNKIKQKAFATNVLKTIRLPSEHLEIFANTDTGYLIDGNKFTEISNAPEIVRLGVKWLETKKDVYIFAVLPVPTVDGSKIDTYAYLFVPNHPRAMYALNTKGNLAFCHAFYFGPNQAKADEGYLCMHLTNSGIYALPRGYRTLVQQMQN